MNYGNKKSGKGHNTSGLRILAVIISRAHMRRAGAVRLALKQKEKMAGKIAY
jgi:hypothetical protein